MATQETSTKQPESDVTAKTPQKKTLDDVFQAIGDLTQSHANLKTSIDVLCAGYESTNEQVRSNATGILSLRTLLEQQKRARNVVIYNLRDIPEFNSNLFDTVNRLFEAANLDIPDIAMEDVFRMGKTAGRRPVLVKFISERWVRQVFKNVMELRKMKIFIANDLSPDDRQKRRVLVETCRQLKQSGKNARIKNNRLLIDDKLCDSPETAQVTPILPSAQLSNITNTLSQKDTLDSKPKQTYAATVSVPTREYRKRGRPSNESKLNSQDTQMRSKQLRLDTFVLNQTQNVPPDDSEDIPNNLSSAKNVQPSP